ncbi:MAG: preprotein translocase subunit YajC [Planctomycetes bacterium]|nr:preprotein translocase subunit YajC [Planctomycetota bacterium]
MHPSIWAGCLTLAESAPFNPFSMMMIVMMFAFLYLVVIRPQKKEADEKAKLMEALKRGDEVLTTGGMYGTVVNLKGEEVTLRIDDQTKAKVRFVKAAIARIVVAEGTASEPAGKPAADEANKS